MATDKKPAPKKAPVKKTRTLAKVPGKTTTSTPEPYRIDYKKGDRVRYTRMNGQIAKGHVVKMDLTGQTGAFVVVDIGTKDVPKVVMARPGRVKAF